MTRLCETLYWTTTSCKDALLQTFRETGAYSSDPEQYATDKTRSA